MSAHLCGGTLFLLRVNTISRLGIDEWSVVVHAKFALRDFRVNRIILQNVIVVIQLSRACGTPSLRLDILQAHSDHSSIPFHSMV
ncbi:hypothetical protein [Rubritalea tangerina]|uniref:hypothetical protein n=1 Tax=Rubritalea tangerina TaxID=430798 RepID=UPI0036073D21